MIKDQPDYEDGFFYNPVVSTIVDLQKRGFHASYNLLGAQIFCPQTRSLFDTNQFEVIEMHTFDYDLFDGQETVVYGIECIDQKGILLQVSNRSSNIQNDILIKKISKFWKYDNQH